MTKMFHFSLKPKSSHNYYLWVLFCLAIPFIIIYIISLYLSETNTIALPFDDETHPCGIKQSEDLSGYPYIYFSNIVSEGISLAETYCISECPNTETKSTTTINNPTDQLAISIDEKTFIFYDTIPVFNKVCLPTSFDEFLIVEPALQMSFIQETIRTVQQQNIIQNMILLIIATGLICPLLFLYTSNIMLKSQTTRRIVYIISELFLLGLICILITQISESPSISQEELNVNNESYANLSDEKEKKEFRINIIRNYFYRINTNHTLSSALLVYFIFAFILHGSRLLQQEIQLSEYQSSSINPELFPYSRKLFGDTMLIFLILIITLPFLTLFTIIFCHFQVNLFAIPSNSIGKYQDPLPFHRNFSSFWQSIFNFLVILPFFAWVLCIVFKLIEFVCVKTILRQISLIKAPNSQPLRSFSYKHRIKQLFIDTYVALTRYNNDVLKFAIYDIITTIASFLYKTIFIIPIIHGYIDYQKLLKRNKHDRNDPPKFLKIIWKYWSNDYLRSMQRKQLLTYFYQTQSTYSLVELPDLIKLSNHSKLLLIGKQFESSLTISISCLVTYIFYLLAYNTENSEHNPANPSIFLLIWLIAYGISSACVSIFSIVQQTFIIYSILWEENTYCYLVAIPLEKYSDERRQSTVPILPVVVPPSPKKEANISPPIQLPVIDPIQKNIEKIQNACIVIQIIETFKKPLKEETVENTQKILKKRNQIKSIPQTLQKKAQDPITGQSEISTKVSEDDMKSYCSDIKCTAEETKLLMHYYSNLQDLNETKEADIQDVLFMSDKNALKQAITIPQESIKQIEEDSQKRQKELEDIVNKAQSNKQNSNMNLEQNSSQADKELATSVALLGLYSIYKSSGFNIHLKGSDAASSSSLKSSTVTSKKQQQNPPSEVPPLIIDSSEDSSLHGQVAAAVGDIDYDVSDCQTYQKMLIMSGQTDGLGYFNISARPKYTMNQGCLPQAQLVSNLKADISACYGIPKESIRLMDFGISNSGDMVGASFRVPDEFRLEVQKRVIHPNSFTHFKDPCITFESLIEHFKLSEDLFDSRYNMQWPANRFAHRTSETRGALPIKGKDGVINETPQPYNFPVDWDGFGINMTDIIQWDTSDWFSQSASIDTWIVLYHATKGVNIPKILDQKQNDDQKDDGKRGVMQKAELKTGYRNACGNQICRINGYLINGDQFANVYLADNIQSCIIYADDLGYQIGNKKFQFIFQCRVNPNHVRSPIHRPEYYTVEKQFAKDSIRPYRLLIKEKV